MTEKREKLTEKEFLYLATYTDTNGNRILKIGTTNDLKRRKAEHIRNYRRSKTHTLPPDGTFEYLWFKPLSKYNTIRYEDRTREKWKELGIGEFVRNDRFILNKPIDFVEITIRKTYQIALV